MKEDQDKKESWVDKAARGELDEETMKELARQAKEFEALMGEIVASGAWEKGMAWMASRDPADVEKEIRQAQARINVMNEAFEKARASGASEDEAIRMGLQAIHPGEPITDEMVKNWRMFADHLKAQFKDPG